MRPSGGGDETARDIDLIWVNREGEKNENGAGQGNRQIDRLTRSLAPPQ
jgi:hypothetical protein